MRLRVLRDALVSSERAMVRARCEALRRFRSHTAPKALRQGSGAPPCGAMPALTLPEDPRQPGPGFNVDKQRIEIRRNDRLSAAQ